MNWRTAILMLGALTSEAAERIKLQTAILPRGGSLNEIAAARESLRQTSAARGETHPLTGLALCNLAASMLAAGYPNYAERYARQSLAILENSFGPDDPSLVLPLNVLTETAFSPARLAEAREFAIRAAAIGPDAEAHYGTALHNLAAVYQVEGNLEGAADLYRKALAVREKFFPAGHPYIQLTRTALDRVQREARKCAR
jgi:tetratricopeptide (TPR) repeat protein